MKLSNAVAVLLSSISVGAFVPSTLRNHVARSFASSFATTSGGVLKMSDAVIDAEPVTEGEKFE
jgi:hypothetical protein